MADTRITIRIPVSTADRIIDLAERNGTNMTEIMRQALAAYMADQTQADRLTQTEARLVEKFHAKTQGLEKKFDDMMAAMRQASQQMAAQQAQQRKS